MVLITPSAITTIAETVKETCISIYMPTHVAGQQTRQGPIRLKNRLDAGRQQLLSLGHDADWIDNILSPASHLLDDAQYEFWEHQDQGLVLFIGESFFQTHQVGYELPELSVVGDRFHITPLLPVLHQVNRILLLSLSQNEAQLYDVSPDSIEPLSINGLPSSLEEALKYDDPEKQLQYHSQGAASPNYHGQGVGTTDEDKKEQIQRYCQKLDHAICSETPTTNAPPLVLAGVDFVQDIFRGISKYPNLVTSGISGNPEANDPAHLQQQALDLLEPRSQAMGKEAWNTYEQMTGSDKLTDKLDDILVAAHRGQVDTLFINPEHPQWGQYNQQTANVERHEQAHPKSDDLLNLAAIAVLTNSGVVYTRPMPTESPAAAILRYPLYADQATTEAIRS
ncbi:MAG: hypothetical protein WBA10_17680 [Elainellaceae cyanobacterium]